MPDTGRSAQRFFTLDVFRGLTVFLMIIVNTPGAGALPFTQLTHADWHGCTVADLVFPSFLFAVGASLPFVMKKWAAMPVTHVLRRILKRSLLLFLVGVALTWYTSMYWTADGIGFASVAHMRVMAVLQRIALCYLIGAATVCFLPDRSVMVVAIVLLLVYWLLLYAFGEPGAQYTLSGNAVRKLDLVIFGEARMYAEKGVAFDPEGLLSTLPATVNLFAGYLATRYLIEAPRTTKVVATLLVIGALLLVLALLWSRALPINKKLWTSSYVVLSTAIDMMVVGLLYYILELKGHLRRAYFFVVFGKNPLFLYVLSNLLLIVFIIPVGNTNLYEWINKEVYQALAAGPTGSLVFALTFTLFIWLVGWQLDRNKIYVRL